MFRRKSPISSVSGLTNKLTAKPLIRTSVGSKHVSNVFRTIKRKVSILLIPFAFVSLTKRTLRRFFSAALASSSGRPNYLSRKELNSSSAVQRTSVVSFQAKRPWLTFKLPSRKPHFALTSIGVGFPTFGLRPPPKFVSGYHSYIARMRRSLQGNITFPFALSDGSKLASSAFQSKQTSLVLCTGDANFYSSLSLLIAYAAAYNQTPSQYVPYPSSLQFLAASCGVPLSSEFGAASFSDSTNWPRLKRTIISSGSNGSSLAAFNAACKHRCRALMYSLNHNVNVSTKRIGCSGFRLGHENERIVTYFLVQCPADAFDMSNVTIIGGHFSLSLLPSNRLICV
ncbi:MAG: SAM-dependent methyltransferase [Candidatus Hodgkinia cicadicola]